LKDTKGYIWNLNDIIIYGSNSEVENQAIVEKIIQLCIEDGLVVNIVQFEFYIQESIFLCNVINSQELQITNINFQGLSDYKNSTTRTMPMLAFILFYSARFHVQLDLFYLSLFAKLQNPTEGKVAELFRGKVDDFPLAHICGNRSNLHSSSPPTAILCDFFSFYGSAAQLP